MLALSTVPSTTGAAFQAISACPAIPLGGTGEISAHHEEPQGLCPGPSSYSWLVSARLVLDAADRQVGSTASRIII